MTRETCHELRALYLIFFILIPVAPMAPHGQFKTSQTGGGMSTEPPMSAARHAHLFKDVKSMSVVYSFFFSHM